MRHTVRSRGVVLGDVDLPAGLLVAGRLDPAPAYSTIRTTVRRATTAFLELGLFGAAAGATSQISASTRRQRDTMARAAGLNLELLGPRGEPVQTSFVNLLESPLDGGVVLVACLRAAGAAMTASLVGSPLVDGDAAPASDLPQ
jgi:hypothetical protein